MRAVLSPPLSKRGLLEPAGLALVEKGAHALLPLRRHARARDAAHAAELYAAGVTEAVPETLESSLPLSEAVLVEMGVAMGPVIASIHEKRDELRREIREGAGLEREPRLRRTRRSEVAG